MATSTQLLAVFRELEKRIAEVEIQTGGPMGPRGPIGPKGRKGERGAAGANGTSGATGASGRNGKDGERGLQGPQGPKGSDGLSGPAGAAGDNGQHGRDGRDGVSITDAQVDFDGHLTVTLSDGSEIDAGKVAHLDEEGSIVYIGGGGGGGKGGGSFEGEHNDLDGLQGNGPEYYHLNEAEWTTVVDWVNNGIPPEDLPTFVGAGTTGIVPDPTVEQNFFLKDDGTWGEATGPQGPPGTSATVDAGTTLTGPEGTNALVTNSGTTTDAIFDFVIPRGDTGAAGQDGLDGADGATGPEGPEGPQGPIGLTGPAGADGEDGLDGATGPEGPEGPQGIQGETGPAGADGADGDDGLDGNTVLSGIVPPTALDGVDGDYYIDDATNIIYGPKAGGVWPTPGTSLVGPAGADGTDGTDGADGPIGPEGPEGPEGPIGLTGPAGEDGLDGADGATGPQGPEGPTAVSADAGNISILGTDSLIFTPAAPAQTYLHADLTDVGPDDHHAELHLLGSHTDVDFVTSVPDDGERLAFDAISGNWVPRRSTSALGIVAFSYRWTSPVDDTPSGGRVSTDNADPTLVTEIYINESDQAGNDNSIYFENIGEGDWFNVIDRDDDTNTNQYDVTATPTLAAGVYTIPVTYFASAGPNFSNNEQVAVFVRYTATGITVHDDLSGRESAVAHPAFAGADTTGFVPPAAATPTNFYLRDDGTWADGVQGPDGTAATVDAGTTTTGAPGTPAVVVNSGDTTAAIFDFTIPEGEKGDQGDQGPAGEGITLIGDRTVAEMNADDGTTNAPGDSWVMLDSGTVTSGTVPTPVVTGDLVAWAEDGHWVNQGQSQGPEGPQGPPGDDGADGTDGVDGAAATVDAGTTTTGLEGTDALVVNSGTTAAAIFDFTIPRGDTGATGPTGADGADGVDGAIGPEGPEGPEGPQGIQGPAGADGADGADGVDGNTVLSGIIPPTAVDGVDGDYYIDTTTDIIYGPKAAGAWPLPGTSLVGPTGATGADGPEGPTGPAGADGTDGLDGAVGPEGPEGPEGPQGIQGETGPAGADGADGADGAAGADGNTVLSGIVPPTTEGVDGDYYIDDATNTIYGPKAAGVWPTPGTSLVGPQGAAGADGADGVDGAVGPEGPEGPEGPTGPAGADGTDGLDGAVGPEGPEGPEGPIGLTGPAGADGTDGADGAAGADGNTVLSGIVPPTTEGVDGDYYIDDATNTIYGPKAAGVWPTPGTSLVGPTGAAGADGADGVDGAVGPEGPTGPAGADGADSTVPGPEGPEGPEGPQGPAGDPAPDDHTLLTNIGTNTHAQIDTHVASTANPHAVTAAQVGAAAVAHTHVGEDIVSGNLNTGGFYRGNIGAFNQPTFSFGADADTGMYAPGTNTLGLITGGVRGITISSSQCVGIGSVSTPPTTYSMTMPLKTTGGLFVYSDNASDTSLIPINLAKGTATNTVANYYIQCTTNNSGSAVGQGRIVANGAGALAFAAFSDRTLKENIVPCNLNKCLEDVMSLTPVEFDYIGEEEGHQCGFVAQDVQQVWPDMVALDEEEDKLILAGMGKTEARLVSAIQAQQAQINELKALLNLN